MNQKSLDALAKGMIVEDADTPSVVKMICLDFYDGLNSAMNRFSLGKEVPTKKLLREVEKCLDMKEKWTPRDVSWLEFTREWVTKLDKVATALKRLSDAQALYDAAIKEAQIDAYDARVMLETVEAQRKMEKPHAAT